MLVRLVLGLTLLSASGENLFDRGTLIYEINIAKSLDDSKEQSLASHEICQRVVVQAFANNRLPLNNQDQASVDDIIKAIDIKFNELNLEELLSLNKEAKKRSVNKPSLSAVAEVFSFSILKQDDNEALNGSAKNYFSHIFSDKNKLEDRGRLINLAATFLLKNPALSHHNEQILRDS